MRLQSYLTLQEVIQAQNRIRPYVNKTPILYTKKISDRTNSTIYLKLENLHETGAFKLRGATNKLLSLKHHEKEKGVSTYSTGNHGVAVSYIAQRLGINATVCISHRVPEAKVKRLEAYDAKVMKVGNSQDEAGQQCERFRVEEGIPIIEPFDDLEIIAGQGTIGLEIIEQVPSIDMVIIPISGGGLFAGIAHVVKQLNPNIEVVGVSMERSAVMYESIQAGKPLSLEEVDTLADSLLGGIGLQNKYTLSAVQEYIDQFVLVTEREIADAMKYMLQEHKQFIEGAAATSIAAIQSGKINVQGKTVVSIITGNNVNLSVLREIL